MIDRPTNAAEKRRAFRRLHEAGCFVIPNPWDVGGARFLQNLGFKALATTSSGHAWSQGCPDGAVPLAGVLMHLRQIVAASDLLVNADFGNGFAPDAAGVGANVGLAIETGVAAVVAAVAPKPVNLLVGSASGLTMEEIAALGVRRVSVGGALARTAWGAFANAARLMAEQGRFDGFATALPGQELDSFFRSDLSGREGKH